MPESTPPLPVTRAGLRSDRPPPPVASSLSPDAATFTPAAAQTLGATAALPQVPELTLAGLRPPCSPTTPPPAGPGLTPLTHKLVV